MTSPPLLLTLQATRERGTTNPSVAITRPVSNCCNWQPVVGLYNLYTWTSTGIKHGTSCKLSTPGNKSSRPEKAVRVFRAIVTTHRINAAATPPPPPCRMGLAWMTPPSTTSPLLLCSQSVAHGQEEGILGILRAWCWCRSTSLARCLKREKRGDSSASRRAAEASPGTRRSPFIHESTLLARPPCYPETTSKKNNSSGSKILSRRRLCVHS